MAIDRTRLAITERDKAILLYLFRNKVVSRTQMHNFFFRDSSLKAVTQRLSKLSRYGLIKSIYFEQNKRPHRAYNIENKGLDLITHCLPYQIHEKQYVSDSIEHDLVLSEINFHMEKLSMIKEVWTEAELQSYKEAFHSQSLLPFVDLMSDRACLVDGKNGARYLALEYERTLKKYSRNRNKLDSYYQHSTIPAVLYVCETSGIMKSLMQVDENLCKDRISKMYFCLMDDVRKSPEKIIFQRYDDRQLIFR